MATKMLEAYGFDVFENVCSLAKKRQSIFYDALSQELNQDILDRNESV